MENEKQNDVVEDLTLNNQPTTDTTSAPETLVTDAAPVINEQPEVVLEPVAVENNVETPVVDNNVEVAVNNEVILEPVPSQAQMEGEQVVEPSLTETVPVVENVDVPNANMDVPNVNPGVGGDVVNPTPEVAMPMDNGAAVVTPEQPKKKKTGLIIGIIVALLIVIAVVAVFVVRSMKSNPYKIFNALVDKGYVEISTTLKEADKKSIKYNLDDSIVVSGNVKLNSNMTEIASYLDYDYDYRLGFDPKKEQIDLSLGMNKDNQVVINGLLSIVRDTLYIKSDKAYDKVLYAKNDESLFADVNFDEYKTNVTVDDVNKLIELYLGYIKKAVKEDKFTTEDGTVKYNGKELEVTKIKYEMNSNDQYEFANSIYESMKSDNEFKELVKKITGIKDDEYSELIGELMPTQEEYAESKTITYYIYTQGFFPEVVGFGVVEGDIVADFIMEDEKGELTITGDGDTLKATVNDDVIEGSLTGKTENITFKIVTKETEKTMGADIDFGLTEDGQSVDVKLSVNFEKVSDKKVTTTYDASVSTNALGNDLTVGIQLKNDVEIGAKLGEVNPVGAVDINTLTDADLAVILNNIKTATVGTPLELLFTIMEEEPVVEYNIAEKLVG